MCRSNILVIQSRSAYDSNHGSAPLGPPELLEVWHAPGDSLSSAVLPTCVVTVQAIDRTRRIVVTTDREAKEINPVYRQACPLSIEGVPKIRDEILEDAA